MGLATTGGCQSEPVIFNSCSFGLRKGSSVWPGGSGPHLLDLNILLLVCPQSQGLLAKACCRPLPYPSSTCCFSTPDLWETSERDVSSRPQSPKPLLQGRHSMS